MAITAPGKSLQLLPAVAALLVVLIAGPILVYWQWSGGASSAVATTQPSGAAPVATHLSKRAFLKLVDADDVNQAAVMLAKDPTLATCFRTEDGATPLHICQSVAMAKLLLANGADPTVKDWHSRATPLRWAVGRLWDKKQSTRDLVEFLRAKGPVDTDIYFAAAIGDTALIEKDLAENPSQIEKNSQDNDALFDSCSPLQVAAYAGQLEAIKLLLAHGANVNNRSGWKQTEALEKATYAGFPDVVELLADHGAKVNGTDKTFSHSPVYAAAMMGRPDILKILLAHGATFPPSLKGSVAQRMQHLGNSDAPYPGSKEDFEKVLTILAANPATRPAAQ